MYTKDGGNAFSAKKKNENLMNTCYMKANWPAFPRRFYPAFTWNVLWRASSPKLRAINSFIQTLFWQTWNLNFKKQVLRLQPTKTLKDIGNKNFYCLMWKSMKNKPIDRLLYNTISFSCEVFEKCAKYELLIQQILWRH